MTVGHKVSSVATVLAQNNSSHISRHVRNCNIAAMPPPPVVSPSLPLMRSLLIRSDAFAPPVPHSPQSPTTPSKISPSQSIPTKCCSTSSRGTNASIRIRAQIFLQRQGQAPSVPGPSALILLAPPRSPPPASTSPTYKSNPH